MFWKQPPPDKRLKDARDKGEIAFLRIACALGDQADALFRRGKLEKGIEIYRALASLDINDKSLCPLVDHARQALESRGIPCDPSIATDHQAWLASLPEHQRFLMLARQSMRALSSETDPDRRVQLRIHAIANFEKAAKVSPLGKKDERIYLAMRKATQP